MKSSSDLRSMLKNIDRKGYPAYKGTYGIYDFGNYYLSIDHVQGDPFASPSKLSIEVKGKKAGFPAEFYNAKYKRIALCDHLTRLFYNALSKISFRAKGYFLSANVDRKFWNELPVRSILQMEIFLFILKPVSLQMVELSMDVNYLKCYLTFCLPVQSLHCFIKI